MNHLAMQNIFLLQDASSCKVLVLQGVVGGEKVRKDLARWDPYLSPSFGSASFALLRDDQE